MRCANWWRNQHIGKSSFYQLCRSLATCGVSVHSVAIRVLGAKSHDHDRERERETVREGERDFERQREG